MMCRSFAHKVLLSAVSLALLCNATTMWGKSDDKDCEQILNNMFNAIKQVKTLRFNLSASERIDTKYSQATSMVKINTAPLKIYYKDLKKGIEVLWTQGQETDALVNPNGFPFINLRLDPYGKLMHRDQHQSINRLGFSYLGNIIYHNLIRYPDTYQKYVHYRCDTTWEGYPCYEVEVNFPDFHYSTYVVKDKGETVTSISAKFYLDDYLVLSANDLSSYEDELKVGQVLKIPNGYSKYTLITTRKDNNLPVHIKVYDEKGLLEEYSFTHIQVNPSISDEEFSSKYADYHF